MKVYNQKDVLISIHIPKTAGSSFRFVLKEWFGEKLYNHYFNEKKGEMPLKLNFKDNLSQSGVCVHGHFNKKRGFGVYDYYPETKQIISIVRDPLEISLSNYFYNKKLKNNGDWYRAGKKIERQQMDLDDYLINANSHLLQFFPWDLNINNFKEIINNNFIHLGVSENLQTTVNILAKKLDKPKIKVPNRNISPRDEQPSKEAIEYFKSRHKLEYAIYNYALEING